MVILTDSTTYFVHFGSNPEVHKKIVLVPVKGTEVKQFLRWGSRELAVFNDIVDPRTAGAFALFSGTLPDFAEARAGFAPQCRGWPRGVTSGDVLIVVTLMGHKLCFQSMEICGVGMKQREKLTPAATDAAVPKETK